MARQSLMLHGRPEAQTLRLSGFARQAETSRAEFSHFPCSRFMRNALAGPHRAWRVPMYSKTSSMQAPNVRFDHGPCRPCCSFIRLSDSGRSEPDGETGTRVAPAMNQSLFESILVRD